MVASFHEFGGANNRPPQRAFFRPTMDANRDEYNALLGRLLDGALAFKLTLKQALGLLGQRVQGDVKKAITDGSPDWPPLAQSTIDRKGSTKPLIDTGNLRQSITYKVELAGEGEGTAQYHEGGSVAGE